MLGLLSGFALSTSSRTRCTRPADCSPNGCRRKVFLHDRLPGVWITGLVNRSQCRLANFAEYLETPDLVRHCFLASPMGEAASSPEISWLMPSRGWIKDSPRKRTLVSYRST